MDKLVGVGIAGVLALITLFTMTAPVANSMTDAQWSFEEIDSDEAVSIAAGEDISETYDTEPNKSIRAEVETTDITDGDEATIDVNGDTETVTENETTTVTADTDEESTFDISADSGNADSVELDYEVEAEEERENAGLYAIVLLMFLMAFSLAVWKAIS